jgi:hypothetical protein
MAMSDGSGVSIHLQTPDSAGIVVSLLFVLSRLFWFHFARVCEKENSKIKRVANRNLDILSELRHNSLSHTHTTPSVLMNTNTHNIYKKTHPHYMHTHPHIHPLHTSITHLLANALLHRHQLDIKDQVGVARNLRRRALRSVAQRRRHE